MRISDWSSDVCSSDLTAAATRTAPSIGSNPRGRSPRAASARSRSTPATTISTSTTQGWRSEEHTSELQSLMRISYAVFCLTKNKQINLYDTTKHILTQTLTNIHPTTINYRQKQ